MENPSCVTVHPQCYFESHYEKINMERGYFRIDLALKLRKNQKEDDMG